MPTVKKTALAAIATFTLLSFSFDAQALALGAITVVSSLGEPLRAEIEIPQISSEEASTFQASMGSPQTFRAAGIDYSPSLAGARVTLQHRPNGQAYLRIVGSRPLNEPYVGVVIEANWSNGRIVRDYTLLLDPPGLTAPSAVVATQPQAPQSIAPLKPSAIEPPPPTSGAQNAPRSRPSAAPIATNPTSSDKNTDKDHVIVQRGDTASRIAAAHAIDGVSLDQMLVALLQANPRAFVQGNVNLMKAGTVLQMPTAAQAQAISRAAARRTIVAQSRDFQNYRHAVAQNVPSGAGVNGGRSRSTSGSVQAQVRDHQAPTPSPDQLEISKGGTASTAESQVARTRQAQEQADRKAELNKNISELSRLQSAASPPVTAAKPTVAEANSVASGLTAPVAAPSAPIAASSSSSAAPALTNGSVADKQTPTATNTVNAGAPTTIESAPTSPVPQAAAPAADPSLLDSLTENPMLPIAGAGLIALLAGFGVYRSRQRKSKDAALDSEFIQSRLQPDSFFGASGGQHVSTKERATGLSSMAYSPSQLEAAGDVDPVAEADVYLAYGRDLQAEEILKEALLTHPGRISIHRKLTEIYAKRRDARALEAIAAEAHALTQGDGPDWQAIATLGGELDPGNPLYKPGGMPIPKIAPTGVRRQFGADTEPQTAQVILSKAAHDSVQPSPLDLTLDLNEALHQSVPKSGKTNGSAASGIMAAASAAASPVTPRTAASALGSANGGQQPLARSPSSVKADSEFMTVEPGLEFASPLASSPALRSMPVKPVQAPASPPNSGMIEFDMSALSVDPDSRSGADIKTEQFEDADDNPLSTKLALAQEFRAIGDLDGARSMASEVVAEASGALKIRAERFLAEL